MIGKCLSPYAESVMGVCVNLLIDVNNCGELKNICGSNYTSCSAGVCSNLSSIIISDGTFIWAASVNKSIDDAYYGVNIPFNITLYNVKTTYVSVSTNGVSKIQQEKERKYLNCLNIC